MPRRRCLRRGTYNSSRGSIRSQEIPRVHQTITVLPSQTPPPRQGFSQAFRPPPPPTAPPQYGGPPPVTTPPPPPPGYIQPSGEPGFVPYGRQQRAPPPLNYALWLPPPMYIPPDIPPGLAYLLNLDTILVVQHIDILEVIFNFEDINRYTIYNSEGMSMYYAYEDEKHMCARVCCGNDRPFELHINDMYHNEIIYLKRPCSCNSCCCFCCLTKMEVYSPPDTPVGLILQKWSPTHPIFAIADTDGKEIFSVEGPCCCKLDACCCCFQADFSIRTLDSARTEVGLIQKHWSGLLREAFTEADVYGVKFPPDLDVRVKATFIGALFLIDYVFYEDARSNACSNVCNAVMCALSLGVCVGVCCAATGNT